MKVLTSILTLSCVLTWILALGSFSPDEVDMIHLVGIRRGDDAFQASSDDAVDAFQASNNDAIDAFQASRGDRVTGFQGRSRSRLPGAIAFQRARLLGAPATSGIEFQRRSSVTALEKYFKKISQSSNETSKKDEEQSPKRICVEIESSRNQEVDLENLPSDPGLRIPIYEFSPNIQDQVRRAYLQRGPFQPRIHEFPQTKFGAKDRRFNVAWFDKYYNWLEYSICKDKAYCLYYYLFKAVGRGNEDDDAFNKNGFSNWKKSNRFELHVGSHNSAHNIARRNYEDLMNQSQHIGFMFKKQTDYATTAYRTRLNASVDCVRFLLRQGLAFRAHDDSDTSRNQGNFLQLLHFLAEHNNEINNVELKNAPDNLKLTAPEIQKDITRAISIAITDFIKKEIGENYFSLLVDEARDISSKEQMAIVVRFVNKKGMVVERFLGIIHVAETTARTLKKSIEELLSTYGLSISKLRGQGYDGASNMSGEFNGLKALFLNENNAAHYIHCFSHQLQLALVYVAKNHVQIALLFSVISNMMNIVGVSCKRRDQLRDKQRERTLMELHNGELVTG
ncbi:hypothetical protein KFK09_028505 [Dendrobium nobile]|uniref:TTF-type domain-containing protein n=1 Tax=Dendrobium nobile TaxID=94219 RepID=A0A8T3A2T9_DENNO|nr:hypothetical protein KFK09_028505 [Dendrobium nobile]